MKQQGSIKQSQIFIEKASELLKMNHLKPLHKLLNVKNNTVRAFNAQRLEIHSVIEMMLAGRNVFSDTFTAVYFSD